MQPTFKNLEPTDSIPPTSSKVPDASFIQIPEFNTKTLKPKLDALLKRKSSDLTYVNIAIRAVNVYDSKNTEKSITQLRYMVLFLTAIVIMMLVFAMIFLSSLAFK